LGRGETLEREQRNLAESQGKALYGDEQAVTRIAGDRLRFRRRSAAGRSSDSSASCGRDSGTANVADRAIGGDAATNVFGAASPRNDGSASHTAPAMSCASSSARWPFDS
jgi:hypothetical protein